MQILQGARAPRSVQFLGCRHMLRQIQPEINMDRPFESTIPMDYSTNNHHSQLRSKDYPDCCSMAFLSWWKRTGAIRVSVRRVNKRNKLRTAPIPKVLKLFSETLLGKAILRTSTNLWSHHEIMKFDNLDESWSFTTRISGSDPQIYPGTFLFLWPFVSCLSKVIVEGQLRIWKPGMKQRSKKDSEKQKSDRTHTDRKAPQHLKNRKKANTTKKIGARRQRAKRKRRRRKEGNITADASAAPAAAADDEGSMRRLTAAPAGTAAPEATETNEKDERIRALIHERKTCGKHNKDRVREISKEIKKYIRENKRLKRQEKFNKSWKKWKVRRTFNSIKSAKKRILFPKSKTKKAKL